MGFLRRQVLTDNNLTGVRFKVFIETGTSNGSGMERVADLFDVCLTCELSRDLFYEARERLNKKRFEHVYLEESDSPGFLRRHIDPTFPTLMFLDAHWMHHRRMPSDRGHLPDGVKQCALMDELAVIFSFQWTAPFAILIDDWRLFNGFERKRRMPKRGYRLEEWPTAAEILKLISQNRCRSRVLGDMLLVERQP